jgi:hypothetical protein
LNTLLRLFWYILHKFNQVDYIIFIVELN